jgi:hypothetical protein
MAHNIPYANGILSLRFKLIGKIKVLLILGSGLLAAVPLAKRSQVKL